MTIAPDEGQNRLWGIPFVGLTIRAILVIPQAIVLWLLAVLAGLSTLFSWIPILVNGRQAAFVYTFTGGYLRLGTRVGGYVRDDGQIPAVRARGRAQDRPDLRQMEEQNRLWDIPLIGLMVRWILLIPHFIVLFFVAIVLGFVSLVTWIPVLVNGGPPTGSSAGWAASTAGSTACMRTGCC